MGGGGIKNAWDNVTDAWDDANDFAQENWGPIYGTMAGVVVGGLTLGPLGAVGGAVAGFSAGYAGKQAYDSQQSNSKAAEEKAEADDELGEATSGYNEEEWEIAQEEHGIKTDEINRQRGDVEGAWGDAKEMARLAKEDVRTMRGDLQEAEEYQLESLELVKQNYRDAVSQIKDSRKRALVSAARQQRGAQNVAVSSGSRGGSALKTVNRLSAEAKSQVNEASTFNLRSATRQRDQQSSAIEQNLGKIESDRERLDNEIERIDIQRAAAEREYGSNIGELNNAQKLLDQALKRAENKYEYDEAVNDYNQIISDIQLKQQTSVDPLNVAASVLNTVSTGISIATGIPNVVGLFQGMGATTGGGGGQPVNYLGQSGGGYGSPGVNPYGNYWGL